jgi:hypothetical protein
MRKLGGRRGLQIWRQQTHLHGLLLRHRVAHRCDKRLTWSEHSLGCPAPSFEQLRVLGAIAVKTALMSIPCGWSKEFEMVPPNQRRTFKSLVSGWAAQIDSNIAQRLSDEKERAA